MYKRSIQLIRDYKSFVLEVVCPILLVIIGLCIANFSFNSDSRPKELSLKLLPLPQTTTYNSIPFRNNQISTDKIFSNTSDEKFIPYSNKNDSSNVTGYLIDFTNYLYKSTTNQKLAGYNVLNTDKVNNIYDSFVFIDLISKDAAPIFLQDHLTRMINAISDNPVYISVKLFIKLV